MNEFITATVDGVQYVCAPCQMNGECHGCTALSGWDGNLCGKLLDKHLDNDGVGICLRNDVIWVVDVRRDEVDSLSDENKALRSRVAELEGLLERTIKLPTIPPSLKLSIAEAFGVEVKTAR